MAIQDNTIIVLTAEQLKEFAAEAALTAIAAMDDRGEKAETPGKRFVYGLRGIRDLFNVSHPTAQRYKNTFLAPAIMQRGRKIITDATMALELYKNEMQRNRNQI